MISSIDPSVVRAELEAEHAHLAAELAEVGAGPDASSNYDPNFADTSQVTAERGAAENLAGELRDALVEIQAALGRLEDGTYGLCESCGGAIGSDRLEAVPTARRCITCAARL